ncbi:hypothetical protein RU639_001456 [Aspergillus parasiticus]
MKRSTTEAGPAPKRSAWQQPVSCEFCRLKKIRCDKKSPCYNCTSRGFACEYASVIKPVQSSLDSNKDPSKEQHHTLILDDKLVSLERNVREINDRLKRVESALLSTSGLGQQFHRTPQFTPPSCNLAESHHGADSPKTWDNLEAIASNPHSATEPSLQRQQPAGGVSMSDHKFIRLNDSKASGEASSKILQHHYLPTTDVPNNIKWRNLQSLLPDIHLARLLFEHYVQTADCLHREIHVPSTRALLEATYNELSRSIMGSDETITFFLSIFASSAFYVCHSHSHSISDQLKDASTWHSTWKEAVISALLQPDAIGSSSLVSLQTILIMTYLTWDTEGQSSMFHTLRSIAHTKAIQMKIHRLDAHHPTEDDDVIVTELKRRLWWHLASTDWLVASVPGSQEGVYSIHPKLMAVKYPLNIDDADILADGPSPKSLPEDQPTSMSFFIQRIKLAELCRDMVDSMQNVHQRTDIPDHEQIRQIIGWFNSFEENLPWFFQMDEENINKTAVLAARRPYIIRQRHVLLFGLYSRLGRLLRPLLIRGESHPSGSDLVNLGINCAEKLLHIRHTVEPEDLCPSFHSHSIDQHSFSALLLLAVDIMRDNDSLRAQDRRKNLIRECEMLREKQISLEKPTNSMIRALDQLIGIIQKSRLPFPREFVDVNGNHPGPTSPSTPYDSVGLPTQPFSSEETEIPGSQTACTGEAVDPEEHAHMPFTSPDSFLCAPGHPANSLAGQDITELWAELLTNFPSPPGFTWEEAFDGKWS